MAIGNLDIEKRLDINFAVCIFFMVNYRQTRPPFASIITCGTGARPAQCFVRETCPDMYK